MRVSAIVVTFNGADFLPAALDSIMRQTEPPAEIIVVDDGSMDETSDVVNGYGASLRYVQQSNRGQGSAINTGVAAARYPYVAFLDHDDRWHPEKVRLQSELMGLHDCDVVVGGVTNETLGENNLTEPRDHGPARLFGACLFKRSAFDVVGPLREDRRIHEIVEWWGRAGSGISVVSDDRTVLFRSIHGANQTIKHRDTSRSDLLARVREVRRLDQR